MSNLILPQINLNGNSRESLLEQYTAAHQKMKEACAAFLDIDFHGRNYQTLPDGSFLQAQEQEKEMCKHYNEICKYLRAHVEHLQQS